ncbi:MAG: hypothetical protein WC323_03985 [Patescibacteria group bacterium]|jgi:hypothetical protein
MKKAFILGFLSLIILTGCSLIPKNGDVLGEKVISTEEAKAKAEEFINSNLMAEGQKATVTEVTEEGNLYKVMVNAGGAQDIESFMSKDGKTFYPQAMDIEGIGEQANNASDQSQPAVNVSVKKDKPEVELFVMSHCPYGTQIEKGILPVLEKLGDKISFDLKFCDYAMHGKTEIDEELNQYCIQKEEPEKLLSYLTCFLADGEGDSCLTKASINRTKLNSCAKSSDSEFKVTQLYNDKTSWQGSYPRFAVFQEDVDKYDIQGSPSLVINGEKVSSSRNSAGLLSAICSGFTEQPEECLASLDSATPAPGFGFEGSGSATTAECN